MFKLSSEFLTDGSGAVHLLMILFAIYVSRLSLSICLVCSLQPCDQERAAHLALLCVMFPCVFVTFPYGVSGQVWYLIVSVPDLCLLYFNKRPITPRKIIQPLHACDMCICA